MKQIPLKDWPRGLYFQLALISDEVIEPLGLHYEAYWEDGLGLHFVAILDSEVGPFAIRRGCYAPNPGADIWCMEDGQPSEERLNAILGSLGLSKDHVEWSTPLEATDSASAR